MMFMRNVLCISRYSKLLAPAMATILLGVAAFVPVANAAGEETVQTAGGVSYVSGGVATDSIDRLTARTGEFNLKLVFALKSGAYLSGVKVAIADAAGRTLVDTTSEGPWLLARIRPLGRSAPRGSCATASSSSRR